MTEITPDSVPAISPTALDEAIQAHLGGQLRALYGDPVEDKLPRRLAGLLDRVAEVIRLHTGQVDRGFLDGIMAALPKLRAYAIALTRNIDQAEDLVQGTVLKAISKQDRFEAGTNLEAWLFTILRNSFFSFHRSTRRDVEDPDGFYAAAMIEIPDQEDKLVIQDLEVALAKLPQEQREAILLVGMEGMPYEDAAQALGCAVGTIKSRVHRARTKLAELLHLDADDLGGGRTLYR